MSLIRLKEISVKLFVREGGGCGFAGYAAQSLSYGYSDIVYAFF